MDRKIDTEIDGLEPSGYFIDESLYRIVCKNNMCLFRR
jgi:hypothetical protein